MRARIGTVGFLNARPLTAHVDRDRYELVADHPRGIAAALDRGEVDVALAPVAAVLSDPALRIVPGFAIGAEGPVDSVLLVGETPIEGWTRLVLDGNSRTSAVLTRVLLAGPLRDRVRPELVVETVAPGTAPEAIGGATGALVIGDPALRLPDGLYRIDLAEVWTRWTGLPFVFAVWAGREGLAPQVVDDLREAGRRGVAELATARPEGAEGVYLAERIRYPLDDRALMGLRRFAALAHAGGWLPREDVHLLGPPIRAPRSLDLDGLLARGADGGSLDAAALGRLHAEARLTDLALAADARRAALHPDAEATYAVAEPVQGLPEGDAPEGVRIVDLPGTLPEATARIAAWRSAGASTIEAGDVAALAALAAGSGRTAGAVIEALVGAGLTVLGPGGADWRDRAGVEQAALVAGLLPMVGVALADDPVDRLVALAALGDRVLAVTPWVPLPEGSLVAPGQPTSLAALRGLALARLALPAVVHVTFDTRWGGPSLAQLALEHGADDLGVVAATEAGVGLPTAPGAAAWRLDVAEIERMIRAAGREPAVRDLRFERLGGPLTRPVRVRRAGLRPPA